MRYAVARLEHFERLASREIIAQPATLHIPGSAALPYLTVGRAAITTAGLLAAHFHHCAKQVIALLVVLELLEERDLCQSVGDLCDPMPPQFIPQVSGQVSYRLRIAGTIATIEAAITNQIPFLSHIIYSSVKLLPRKVRLSAVRILFACTHRKVRLARNVHRLMARSCPIKTEWFISGAKLL